MLKKQPLGDLTFEVIERVGGNERELRVYGVDRHEGLTSETKYAAEKLNRYKVIKPGMFAYNPMRLNIGSIGFCSSKHNYGLVSPDYVVFGCHAGMLDPDFLSYAIRGPEWLQWSSSAGVGSVRVRIYYRELARMLLTIPPYSEQREIASVLGALDDKIELNRRMNETLEALAQSLFKSWFVDATQSAFPKGWREGSILEVAKLLSGGTPKTEREDYWNGGILWASAKDVSQCGQTFLVTTERTITKKGLEESPTQLIPAFCTVVVARGATTGRMTMFGCEIAMNQTCYALASTTGTPFALYCLFRHAINDLVQTAHGSVFDTITSSTFAASKVVLPAQQVFDAFDKTVTPIFARILSNIKESRTLAALRDALLPKLLSGELRVPRNLESA